MNRITEGKKLETIDKKLRRHMGDWAFIRYIRNIGISFEDAYWIMFGKEPTR